MNKKLKIKYLKKEQKQFIAKKLKERLLKRNPTSQLKSKSYNFRSVQPYHKTLAKKVNRNYGFLVILLI